MAPTTAGEDGLTVAVTGAAGYLGSLLVSRLLAEPGVREVRAIDLGAIRAADPRVQPFALDVRAPEIADALRGADIVVHLAFVVVDLKGRAPTLRSPRDRAGIDAVNVGGSENVFRAALATGARQVVYTSSVAAYGAWPDNPPRITEDCPRRPMPGFYYSETKVRVEELLDQLEPAHPQVAFTRLRPHIVIGPHATRAALDSAPAKVLPVLQPGDPEWQLVWETDVVEAIMCAIRRRARGAFNVAGAPCRVSEGAAALGARVLHVPYWLARARLRLGWAFGGGLHPGWGQAMRHPIIVDTTRARTELGWEPRYTTLDCLRALRELRAAGGSSSEAAFASGAL